MLTGRSGAVTARAVGLYDENRPEGTSRRYAKSEPTLYRLCYVAWELIKAYFGLRCVFVHDVN
jgi:hypothetical protein